MVYTTSLSLVAFGIESSSLSAVTNFSFDLVYSVMYKFINGRVVESVDTLDLKSNVPHGTCEFKSRLDHHYSKYSSGIAKGILAKPSLAHSSINSARDE